MLDVYFNQIMEVEAYAVCFCVNVSVDRDIVRNLGTYCCIWAIAKENGESALLECIGSGKVALYS